jgi:hypothetical protein
MAIERPEGGYAWIDVPLDKPVSLTCCGEPASWRAHWVTMPGYKRAQPVRCTSLDHGDCALCNQGVGYRVRYVVPVLLDGAPRLLEIGRTQWPWIEVRESLQDWVGCRFAISRERPVKNAPLIIVSLGRAHVSEEQAIDVRGVVATLGRDMRTAWDHNRLDASR